MLPGVESINPCMDWGQPRALLSPGLARGGQAGPPVPPRPPAAVWVRVAEGAGEISGARPWKRERWAPNWGEAGAGSPSESSGATAVP